MSDVNETRYQGDREGRGDFDGEATRKLIRSLGAIGVEELESLDGFSHGLTRVGTTNL